MKKISAPDEMIDTELGQELLAALEKATVPTVNRMIYHVYRTSQREQFSEKRHAG